MGHRFLALLLVLAAPASFLFSVSEAAYRTAPSLAAQLFAGNAAAHEQEAQVLHRAAMVRARNPAAPPPPRAAQAARAAYEQGPLVPDALQIVARDLARTDRAAGFALLQEANRLSRRSTAVNVDLLTAYAERRQDTAGLQVLDQLLRRQTAGHGQLLDAMTGLVANPAMHEPMLLLLRTDPPWAPQFWRQLAQSPAGLSRAAQLRLWARQRGIGTEPELDRLLVDGLAGQKRFAQAAQVARAVFPAMLPATPTVHDPRFRREAGVLPFTWRLFNEGDHGAAIDGERGGLAVDALAGARGTVAEQLVRLPAGRMRLAADVTGGTPDHLPLRLTCVDGAERVLFDGSAARLPTEIGATGCRWAMLRIGVAVPSDAEAGDWLVRQVSLDPVP